MRKNKRIPGRKRIWLVQLEMMIWCFSRDCRQSKSSSCGNDDRVEKEQQAQSELVPSSTVVAPTTLSSKIETMIVETTDTAQEEKPMEEVNEFSLSPF